MKKAKQKIFEDQHKWKLNRNAGQLTRALDAKLKNEKQNLLKSFQNKHKPAFADDKSICFSVFQPSSYREQY